MMCNFCTTNVIKCNVNDFQKGPPSAKTQTDGPAPNSVLVLSCSGCLQCCTFQRNKWLSYSYILNWDHLNVKLLLSKFFKKLDTYGEMNTYDQVIKMTIDHHHVISAQKNPCFI